MKYNVLLSAAFFMNLFNLASFYDFQFTSIEGNARHTSEFHGKKAVIIILPSSLQVEDSLYLQYLDSVSKAQPGIVMMGVPSYEDGYSDSTAQDLQAWYRTYLDDQFIISSGMHTRKLAGESQHGLLQWLTSKDHNLHFDQDTEGPGQQFFVNEHGFLYGVAGPAAKLSDEFFNHMLQ